MTKFGEYGKIGLSGFLFYNIRFWQLQDKNKKGVKLEDRRYFEAWKMTKKYQGVRMEEIQAKS
jgi:hypothetical protein